MASFIETFSLLNALFVSGNEVDYIQTVTILVASSLSSFFSFYSSPPSFLPPVS